MTFRVIEDPQNQQIILKLNQIPGSTVRAIRSAFYQLGRINRTEGRKNITPKGKTGRLYRVKGRKRRVRASAPGEEPSNRTGRLRKSVNFEVHGANEMEFGYDQSAPYGKFLETGTRGKRGSRVSVSKRPEGKKGGLEPRPNLLLVVHKTKRDAMRLFQQEFVKEISRGVIGTPAGTKFIASGKTFR